LYLADSQEAALVLRNFVQLGLNAHLLCSNQSDRFGYVGALTLIACVCFAALEASSDTHSLVFQD
jgi:hypothetical protein